VISLPNLLELFLVQIREKKKSRRYVPAKERLKEIRAAIADGL